MPKASVIITTHNRPGLLPRAVESARLSGGDVEIVVVDDASTDETAKVCESLAGIRYVRVERNRRVAGARNIGLMASTAEYVSFLDDDDVRLAHTLDRQVEALEAAPEAGMIYGQAYLGDVDCTPTARLYPARCPQGDLFWELLEQNFIPCGSVVFRRSCLDRVGILDEAVPGLDDWDLWLRISEFYPVVVLEQPVIVWRQSTPASGQGTSHAAELVRLCARQYRERWMNSERALNAPGDTLERARRGFATNMVRHLVFEAGRALELGQYRQASTALSTAAQLFPPEMLRAVFSGANVRALCSRLRVKMRERKLVRM